MGENRQAADGCRHMAVPPSRPAGPSSLLGPGHPDDSIYVCLQLQRGWVEKQGFAVRSDTPGSLSPSPRSSHAGLPSCFSIPSSALMHFSVALSLLYSHPCNEMTIVRISKDFLKDNYEFMYFLTALKHF